MFRQRANAIAAWVFGGLLPVLGCSVDRSGIVVPRDGGTNVDGRPGGTGGRRSGGGTGGLPLDPGSGGVLGTGGMPGVGGQMASGGSTGSGSSDGSSGSGGGTVGSGGSSATGGSGGTTVPGTGGSTGSGGVTVPGTGGATGTGGVSMPGTGGVRGTGGMTTPGTGGMTIPGTGGVMGTGGSGTGGRGTGGGGGTAPDLCRRFPNARPFAQSSDATPHCYWFHSNALTWPLSMSACRDEGGHLATITSADENRFVVQLIPSFGNGYVSIGGTDGRDPDDSDGSGPYRWITGERMSFQNWAEKGEQGTQEPDGYCDSCEGEPCNCDHRVAITSSGKWEDRWEENPRPFVCEGSGGQ